MSHDSSHDSNCYIYNLHVLTNVLVLYYMLVSSLTLLFFVDVAFTFWHG